MFIKYIFIPHLEDTYLDLGPNIMSLCTREFTINVKTNSSQVTYQQTSGEPMVINVADPFNPIINIEQVRGKFTLVAYADDEITDSVNILSELGTLGSYIFIWAVPFILVISLLY